MMRTITLLFLLLVAVAASERVSPMLRSSEVVVEDAPSIYDCLQAASGGDECRSAFDGQCVWCAEPIYGLCVTPAVAKKIGMLPFFTCDEYSEEEEEEELGDAGKSAQVW